MIKICNEIQFEKLNDQYYQKVEKIDNININIESFIEESDKENYKNSFVNNNKNECDSVEYQDNDNNIDVEKNNDNIEIRKIICVICRKIIKTIESLRLTYSNLTSKTKIQQSSNIFSFN